MLPTSRMVWLLAAPALLALGLLVQPELMRSLLLLDGAILVLALIDALTIYKPVVHATRECPEVLSVGRPNPVRIQLRSFSRRKLRLRVNNDLFESASADGLPAQTELRAKTAGSVDFKITPSQRGAYELGAVTVRYPSVLGLWQRQLHFAPKTPVRVYPDLLQLRTYELMARENREFEFVRATKRRGGESEFARLRDYTKDDEYRSIDWRATARRQRLTAREYQLESNQELVFMLDGGRMMSAEVQGLTQFDHALNAALMLGHVALRTGDQVGLIAFDSTLRAFVPPARGQGAAGRLIRAAYDLHPELVESDYEGAFRNLSVRQRKRALVVLFTQVLDDTVARTLIASCRAISKQHLPLVVLFRDLEVEAMLESRRDDRQALYARGAAAEVLRWRQGFIRDLRHGGAMVLDVGPRELTPRLINHYYEIKSRHWL